jgi:hypothetical protein
MMASIRILIETTDEKGEVVQMTAEITGRDVAKYSSHEKIAQTAAKIVAGALARFSSAYGDK